MSIDKKYNVSQIPFEESKSFILRKHYKGELPSIPRYTFGLFEDKELKGVSTFGPSANYKEREAWGGYDVLELSRLVTKDNMPKNTLSFFVSRCLKRLPTPCVVIAYSDPNFGHHGYIYQATNWVYTGKGNPSQLYKNKKTGKIIHSRTVWRRYGTNNIDDLPDHIEKMDTSEGKHRYYYFVGNSHEKEKMKGKLRFEEKSYPKGENKKHKQDVKVSGNKRLL